MSAAIDTGDTVRFLDTGEDLVVARVDGGYLWWLGWPAGRAMLDRFELLTTASPGHRANMLRAIAGSDHSCARWAFDRLVSEELAARGLQPMIDAVKPCSSPAQHGRSQTPGPTNRSGTSSLRTSPTPTGWSTVAAWQMPTAVRPPWTPASRRDACTQSAAGAPASTADCSSGSPIWLAAENRLIHCRHDGHQDH